MDKRSENPTIDRSSSTVLSASQPRTPSTPPRIPDAASIRAARPAPRQHHSAMQKESRPSPRGIRARHSAQPSETPAATPTAFAGGRNRRADASAPSGDTPVR